MHDAAVLCAADCLPRINVNFHDRLQRQSRKSSARIKT